MGDGGERHGCVGEEHNVDGLTILAVWLVGAMGCKGSQIGEGGDHEWWLGKRREGGRAVNGLISHLARLDNPREGTSNEQ